MNGVATTNMEIVLAKLAKEASLTLGALSLPTRNAALQKIYDTLIAQKGDILAANKLDMEVVLHLNHSVAHSVGSAGISEEGGIAGLDGEETGSWIAREIREHVPRCLGRSESSRSTWTSNI